MLSFLGTTLVRSAMWLAQKSTAQVPQSAMLSSSRLKIGLLEIMRVRLRRMAGLCLACEAIATLPDEWPLGAEQPLAIWPVHLLPMGARPSMLTLLQCSTKIAWLQSLFSFTSCLLPACGQAHIRGILAIGDHNSAAALLPHAAAAHACALSRQEQWVAENACKMLVTALCQIRPCGSIQVAPEGMPRL